ncbi:uncharacterized protein BX664DRAFT_294320 [Halteromyces radiatus]|uniref:uncharacterized protein n=1 Tax=Halteromyces radiatus TaxID=101107 RepID=UPI00221F3284|nr:uncharacterized protein BX664DRAFT_294320 [Halteromyces radiatus]KAI8092926.1 hypothetical protein BX664DRAFT_294320 [Halteromyces radiatus]
MLRIRTFYLIFILLFTLFTILLLHQTQQDHLNLKSAQQYNNSSEEKQYWPQVQYPPEQEQFLSYFPNGDFMDQFHSLRNGLRLALDTNRTLILPYLRLGKTLEDWVPFDIMANRYEAQNKTKLFSICYKTDLAENDDDCKDLYNWVEIPWSTLFDLSVFKKHSVRVVERQNLDWKHGGGWLPSDSSAVVVVDPLTFMENGSVLDTHEQQNIQQHPIMANTSPMQKLWKWLRKEDDSIVPLPMQRPLSHRYASTSQLVQLNTRLLQFGSVSQSSAFVSSKSDQEIRLLEDVSHQMIPNHFLPLTEKATNIINALGGPRSFTVLHLHLPDLIQRETTLLQTDLWMEEEEEEMEKSTVSQDILLAPETFLEMMNAIVFELAGDIPINQAVSAALPIQPSLLLDHLNQDNDDDHHGPELLKACIDYRNKVDSRYPIIYLIIDKIKMMDENAVLKPLLELFPCLFTRNDLQKWKIIESGWNSLGNQINGMEDYSLMDYDDLLGPFLDILIANESYSFLETPSTALSMFVAKLHHMFK